VINFAAGELDLDTSPLIKEGAHKAIDAGHTQYTDTLGITELRERLAHNVSRATGVPYALDEVGVTSGAKQALFNTALVVFEHPNEVIIPAPYWVTFPEQVRLAGATPVFVPTADSAFQIDPDTLARSVTPRTRGIILNTPNNPTGAVYGESVLRSVAALAIKHDLTVIFDECYAELVYAPATHLNIVKLVPEMKERTILVGSFSKTFCMAGWRAGFMAGPKTVLKAVGNLQSHSASNPCNLAQYAALAALDPANDGFIGRVREQLHRQREIALNRLVHIPSVRCVAPHGAFYLFPDVSSLLTKSFAGERLANVDVLAEMLLEHAHVAVVPGTAFGSDRHVRISFAIPVSEIEAGMASLDGFVRTLS
jgi:aspartate aminotransferase